MDNSKQTIFERTGGTYTLASSISSFRASS